MGLSTSDREPHRGRAFDAALTLPKSANFFVAANVIQQRARALKQSKPKPAIPAYPAPKILCQVYQAKACIQNSGNS